jgi:hypothetical protein
MFCHHQKKKVLSSSRFSKCEKSLLTGMTGFRDPPPFPVTANNMLFWLHLLALHITIHSEVSIPPWVQQRPRAFLSQTLLFWNAFFSFLRQYNWKKYVISTSLIYIFLYIIFLNQLLNLYDSHVDPYRFYKSNSWFRKIMYKKCVCNISLLLFTFFFFFMVPSLQITILHFSFSKLTIAFPPYMLTTCNFKHL